MQTAVSKAGKQLRPHAKAHKCLEVAKRQREAGAVGVSVGSGGVVGVDFTPEQVRKATRLRDAAGIGWAEFAEGPIDDLPFEEASFDVVISNGVINLSPVKARVFSEAARVLRPGGRLALADIVSAKPLKEKTRRNTELWAACIAGAIPRRNDPGERLSLHLGSRARRLQHVRGRERLARR